MTQYWLMKSEPEEYGWDDLVRSGEGVWDGVRNAQASNYMRAMAKGDRVYFYHSRTGLEIVGIMTIAEAAFPDPKDESGRWVAVRVKPERKLAASVSLKAMKANPALADLAILKQSRLSVAPVTREQWDEIERMAAC